MIPKGKEMMGAEEVFSKFGVHPSLFRDYQAIMGDKAVRTNVTHLNVAFLLSNKFLPG